MPLIPETVLDEIQSRADIAEWIGRYVPLKRAGRHFKALCPFHKERTPSFHINTDKQIFHCFGCGVGGNIFSFLMQQERLTFPEAVRQVADHVGVVVPEPEHSPRNGPSDTLLPILEKACRYYERVLAHPKQGQLGRDYLKQRGVTAATREVFRIGCAPSGWDGLAHAAGQSRIPQPLLEQAGLVTQGSRGPIDRFRGRLVFPIQDVRGRVIGFGGRSLAGQEPKYLNSPESAVYSKGRQLFGLFQAKAAIAKAACVIVVEGYFDCVMLWQAGLTHAVSPLGTAFTSDQARLLRRYTDHVVLAFDPDVAGETASLRGIDLLVEAGFIVHVAQLPAGVDPDEVIRTHGPRAFEERLAAALGVMEFLLACAHRRYPLRDAEGKVQAAQFILPTVARVGDAMLRAEYVRVLAERLGLDEAAVSEELRKVKPRGSEPAPKTPARRGPLQGAEQLLTALILDQPARWEAVKQEPWLGQLGDARLNRILAVMAQLRETDRSAVTPIGVTDEPTRESLAAKIISRLAGDETAPLVSELVELAHSVSNHDQAFRDCRARLRKDAQKRHLDVLTAQLRAAQDGGEDREVTRLLTDIQHVVTGGKD